MFKKTNQWGQHQIYSYDINKHKFIEYFKKLYQEENLEMLHLKSADYNFLKNKKYFFQLNYSKIKLIKFLISKVKPIIIKIINTSF